MGPSTELVRDAIVPVHLRWPARALCQVQHDIINDINFNLTPVATDADAMKFNGPAPEIVNGRLAMLGIIAAALKESKYSETVMQQVPHVAFRLILLGLLVTYSSLVPILKGAKSEAFGEHTSLAWYPDGAYKVLLDALACCLQEFSLPGQRSPMPERPCLALEF